MTERVSIQPGELRFPFELKKQISCSLRLVNNTDDSIAFKVKTTSPKKYCVRPNTGIVPARGSTDVTVTMQAQKEAPLDMQCKDKFLVQTIVVPAETTVKDVPEMFNKDSGHDIHDTKLRVVLTSPPQPPSPVAESPEEEGVSPKAMQNGDSTLFQQTATKDTSQLEANLAKVNQELFAIRKERDSAVQLSQRLQQELASKASSLKERNGPAAGFSLWLIFLVGLLGILIGYLISS
ncbi:hypothetical protein SELMODRAFT_147661 [Selaginella moellendorffii]|uniref:MSP domain-containing protein n=1 Tax=Selaginella moellendorffii TaxID=88036 RepID=D8RJK1_SELML|nr:vesicle-associated protein 1-2 [Selaginella moellendorffii]EFJ27732.1 hypothetical protein SELMODRAFT_147661 [Selaginella moellendorffii]|eukprot:XP_002971134.1 vesicle-associated protein 1-2 [Selaginella moellendorffii]